MRFQELFLVQDFESDDELGLFLSGQVDMTELASTQGFTDLEVIDGPFLALELLVVRLHWFMSMSIFLVALRGHHPWHS